MVKTVWGHRDERKRDKQSWNIVEAGRMKTAESSNFISHVTQTSRAHHEEMEW